MENHNCRCTLLPPGTTPESHAKVVIGRVLGSAEANEFFAVELGDPLYRHPARLARLAYEGSKHGR
jgi:hypothetical protein